MPIYINIYIYIYTNTLDMIIKVYTDMIFQNSKYV